MVLHKWRSSEKIRASITIFLIDVIHNGLHRHWSHKVRVPCNLSLNVLLVSGSLIFDLKRIAEKIKCLFQAGIEICLSLIIILLLYNSFYILVPFIFPLLFQPAISTWPAISTGYWCLSMQGWCVFVLLVCNYGHYGGFIGQLLLQ